MSSYYISRKSFTALTSIMLAVLALIAGIQYFTMLYSAGGNMLKMTAAAGISVSAMLYIIMIILFGRSHLKMIVLPVVAGFLSLSILSGGIISGGTIIGCGVIYILFMLNVIKTGVLMVYLLGVSVIFHLFGIAGGYFVDGHVGVKSMVFFLTVSSLYFATIAMKRDFDGFTLKWNDRAYGRRVRGIHPMSQLTAYFMPGRIGAQNLIRDSLELEKVEEYIAKKRKQGLKGFGFMHVFVAAYLRVIALYPGANRFLAGQKVYSRFSCQISFTIKKAMSEEAPDTTLKLDFMPGITSDEVFEKISKEVDGNKGDGDDSTFDVVTKVFSAIPGVLLKFIVWFIKVLDYFGLLPTFLEDVSPFHGSMFFTSMASLGIPVIHHHLYNFGNVPVFCAFGKKYKMNELALDGSVVEKKYMDYTMSVDERICDGYYFAQVLKEFKKILLNPECLDEPIKAKSDIL